MTNFRDPQHAIDVIRDRMASLSNRQINSNTITTVVQSVFDLTVLVENQERRVEALEKTLTSQDSSV